ncbi:MAG TPA: ATP-binding protein [Terriglobales bacterium]|nr:ATP-binding protein [Terriglobales bacterium]
MRSIFYKIFLSFWITQALFLGLALVLAERPTERVLMRWRSLTADALKLYDQNAVSFLEKGQPEKANLYLQELERSADVQFFWFSPRGDKLFGGNDVPSHVRQLAGHVARSGQPQFIPTTRATFGGQVATAKNGDRYVLVAQILRGHGPFALRRTTEEFIVRLGLAILVSGFVCFWLARYLTGPIVRLRTATHQLASGNLGARAAETKRTDEIAELIHDFNRMAERLEMLLNSQKQLLSDISHELRSPLARLNVALGLARQRAGEDSTKALDRIELEADRLNEMIGKLLTLARMESGEPPTERSLVHIPDLLEEVVADADFEARSRDCGVKLLQAEGCTTLGNPGLLRSAFENVVRNALRYTAPRTDVEIRLRCQPQNGGESLAVITVRDYGPGVPDQEIKNLFRPFYRLDVARERQTGGAGLGLAIADRAIRLHQGTITVRNAEGGGLLVEIRLPASPVPSSAMVGQT